MLLIMLLIVMDSNLWDSGPKMPIAKANTLTFLFENEYNETTTMAECRNSIDKIMMEPNGLLNYVVFSGKLLNNLGDMESCQLVV